MIRFFRTVFMTIGILTVFLAVLIFRPVPIVREDKCQVVEGKLVKVYESGVKDISVVLENQKQRYYINRGLENGLNMEQMKSMLGKEVVVKFPDYWTPLDWNNTVRHLSKFECEGRVIFDETYKVVASQKAVGSSP